MISFGIDDKSTYKKNKEIVSKYLEIYKDDPDALTIEITPKLQYLMAQQYCLGFTDGAAQYLGINAASKFEEDNIKKDTEAFSEK